ncbi:MAG: S66 peptidase family protein [Candidatus Woesearchaeota archaeon]|jgi:muramoyltetrapeptide carboxypeptidase LdcA involved in peptidoglycan recycling
MIKPKKLHKGDTVAIVSPSWGGPSVFPHIYESGIETLKRLGFKIKEFPSARKDADYLYLHPEFRAKSINQAFADKTVKAIFATIGGDDSIRILPFLDLKMIKKNPKLIMGYSDTTTLTSYLNQLGLVTFNGPSIMAGFSQWNSLEESFHRHIKTILFENPKSYEYKPYKYYCHGYLGWNNKKNVGKTKPKIKNPGWNWLQGKSIVKGELFGGCIEVLEFMKGTKFWPKETFWQGRILFLELSNDKPTPEQVKWMIRNYGTQGILDKISALIIGRPMKYNAKERKELEEKVLKVVKVELKNTSLPIIMNMDFGHTDPQWILPLGIKAEIDCKNKRFRLVEKVFKD